MSYASLALPTYLLLKSQPFHHSFNLYDCIISLFLHFLDSSLTKLLHCSLSITRHRYNHALNTWLFTIKLKRYLEKYIARITIGFYTFSCSSILRLSVLGVRSLIPSNPVIPFLQPEQSPLASHSSHHSFDLPKHMQNFSFVSITLNKTNLQHWSS